MLDRYRGPIAEIDNDGRFFFDVDDPDEDAWLVVVTAKGNWAVVDHAREILMAGADVPVPEATSLRGTVRSVPDAADPPRVAITYRPPMADGPRLLRDHWRLRLEGTVTVDIEGGFTVGGLMPGRYRVNRVRDLSSGLNGMSRRHRFPLHGEDVFLRPGKSPRVTLGRVGGAKVCGSVVDEAGRPVGGVAVTVDDPGSEPGYVDAVVADALGKYCLTDISTGDFVLQVHPLGSGDQRTGRAEIEVLPTGGGNSEPVTIDPIVVRTVGPMTSPPDDRRPAIPVVVGADEPGGEITGRVIDRSGKVDFGTTEVWIAQTGSTDLTPTEVDADGRFHFRVRPGQYFIGPVETPEGTTIMRPRSRKVGPISIAVDESKTRDITIVPTHQISGQLVRPDGRAFRGQILMIAVNRVASDIDGSFRDLTVPTIGAVGVTFFGDRKYKTREYTPEELREPIRLEVASFAEPLAVELSRGKLERLDPDDSRSVDPIDRAMVVRLWHPHDRSEIVRRRGDASFPTSIIAVDWDRTTAMRIAAEIQTPEIDPYWAGPGGDRLPGPVRHAALPTELSIE